MKKELIVVVLAAGVGKRFEPFVTDKSIFPILDEPLMFYNVRKLAAAGFSRFVVVTNAANDACIRSLAIPNVRIDTIIQKKPSGMGDALLTVSDLLTGHPILVVGAEDMVEEALYLDIAAKIRKAEPFIVGRVTSAYFDGGYVKLSQHRLMGVVEKPGEGNEPSKLVNLIFHYFPLSDTFLDRLKRVKTSRDDHYERALDLYAKEFLVSVLSYGGYWTPLKYPWHVLNVMDGVLEFHMRPGRGRNVDIRNNVSMEGAVYIGSNVKIFENTKIVGPVYIGDNTIIGNNNIIRSSIIRSDSVTGCNTDITRSYIGDNCWFHSNYIGDSVLEGNVSMGSGSVLANLRLDEGEIRSVVRGEYVNTHRTKLGAMVARDVRIGVNTSIMPGVKIGKGSFIGAGVTLDADVPEESFCSARHGYEVKTNQVKLRADNRKHYKKKI